MKHLLFQQWAIGSLIALFTSIVCQAADEDFPVPRIDGQPTLADFADMQPITSLAKSMNKAENFVQREPYPGEPSAQHTEAYIGYDDANRYVVFLAFDENPELIRSNMAARENIYQDDPVYQTLSLLGLSDEAIDKFIKTTGDIPESVVDASIYIGQKLRDAGILEEPRAKKKKDGGTVHNRKMFLGGGEVDGPGGEKEDLVPIWASPNEYVVSAKGVRRMGGGDLQQGIAALDRINFGDERYG